MTSLLVLKLDGGDRTYPTKDIDFFNLVCELEAANVDVMGLTDGNIERSKIFTTMRALLAVLINVQAEESGKLLSQHLRNGGTLDEIMNAFTGAMEDAGFGASQESEEETETAPKTAPKAKRGRKTGK